MNQVQGKASYRTQNGKEDIEHRVPHSLLRQRMDTAGVSLAYLALRDKFKRDGSAPTGVYAFQDYRQLLTTPRYDDLARYAGPDSVLAANDSVSELPRVSSTSTGENSWAVLLEHQLWQAVSPNRSTDDANWAFKLFSMPREELRTQGRQRIVDGLRELNNELAIHELGVHIFVWGKPAFHNGVQIRVMALQLIPEPWLHLDKDGKVERVSYPAPSVRRPRRKPSGIASRLHQVGRDFVNEIRKAQRGR